MRPEPDKKTIAAHLFPFMSRSKGNEAVKFGQLIEYNIRNIFVEKSLQKNKKATWDQFPSLIFFIIFKEIYFSGDALLTGQISVSRCLYFLRS